MSHYDSETLSYGYVLITIAIMCILTVALTPVIYLILTMIKYSHIKLYINALSQFLCYHSLY